MRIDADMVFDASAYVRASQRNRSAVDYLRAFMYGGVRLHVPPHFLIEVANALRNTVVGRQSTADDARLALNAVKIMSLEVHNDPELATEALDFALERGITAYDAGYAVLALRTGASLVTADSGLARAAQAAGVAATLILDEAAS